MNGTFTPIALNAPITIFTHTATTQTIYTFFIDGRNLVSGDAITIAINTDTTGIAGSLIVDTLTITSLGTDDIACSYPIISSNGDTFSIILTQTTGVLTTCDWAVNMLEH